MQRRGGDERHDADHALAEHRAVADRPDVAFLVDHLRRRPGGDERVEAGNRAAGDRDEHEREERPGNDRAAAADELGERRRLQLGVDDDDADDQERRSCRSS